MKTPDGRQVETGRLARAAAALVRRLAGSLRGLYRALVFVIRAIGKFCATVWRLAGALDAALWRGVTLAAFVAGRAIRYAARVAGRAASDFVRWLPTRSGRAYSAFSAIWLIIFFLWVIDTLRVSPSDLAATGGDRKAPVDEDDPILARIEGRYVHLTEVEAAARASGALRPDETLTPDAAFERRLVESYVEQRLLARAATEEGVPRGPGVAGQLAAARERILAAAYLEARISEATTEDAIERLYRAQSDVTRLGDEVRARHILVGSGQEAAAVIAALDAGGDFATLARELSKDRATAQLGGDLDYFSQEMMIPPLADAAFSTPVGSRAPPFQTELGWHVLEVTDRRRTSGVPLANVRDNIRRFLTLRTIEATLAELKQQHDVVYFGADADGAAAPRQDDAADGLSPGGN